MLITPKGWHLPTKNEQWAIETPNEVYRDNIQYQAIVHGFGSLHQIPGPVNFHEVRITKQRSWMECSSRWWDDPLFMDKVFWVFHKPMTFRQPTGEALQYFALEPYENLRVIKALYEKTGFDQWDWIEDLLIIPADCLEMAWDETSAGYSDHIRYKPQICPTEQDVEKEAQKAIRIKKIQERIKELPPGGLGAEPTTKEDVKKILGT